MDKFAIYSKKFDGFFLTYQGKGLEYNQDAFGGLDNARLYVSRKRAIESAMELLEFDPIVTPVEIIPDISAGLSVKELVRYECDAVRDEVEYVKAMSSEEVEKLSKKQWKEHKKRVQFIRERCIEGV